MPLYPLIAFRKAEATCKSLEETAKDTPAAVKALQEEDVARKALFEADEQREAAITALKEAKKNKKKLAIAANKAQGATQRALREEQAASTTATEAAKATHTADKGKAVVQTKQAASEIVAEIKLLPQFTSVESLINFSTFEQLSKYNQALQAFIRSNKEGLANLSAILGLSSGLGALPFIEGVGPGVGIDNAVQVTTQNGLATTSQGAHQALQLGAEAGSNGVTEGVTGVQDTQQFISLEQKIANASLKVQEGYKFITQWLGEGSRAIIKDSGDLILMSKDGLRKMRFDIINPHGYPPHMHLEIFRNGKWRNAIPGIHHLYPKQ